MEACYFSPDLLFIYLAPLLSYLFVDKCRTLRSKTTKHTKEFTVEYTQTVFMVLCLTFKSRVLLCVLPQVAVGSVADVRGGV